MLVKVVKGHEFHIFITGTVCQVLAVEEEEIVELHFPALYYRDMDQFIGHTIGRYLRYWEQRPAGGFNGWQPNSRKEVKMKHTFLVQYDLPDMSIRKLMSENEVIALVDASDYLPISNLYVFDVTYPALVMPLTYKGWQPCNLIEFTDQFGNTVISGCGTDH